MDCILSAGRGHADSDILHRAAENAHRMSLEMSDNDHFVKLCEHFAHIGIFHIDAVLNLYLHVFHAVLTVGNHNGATHCFLCEAMDCGSLQMVLSCCTASVGNKRGNIGVHHIRQAAQAFYFIRNSAYPMGPQVQRTAPLSHMYLDTHLVSGFDHILQSCIAQNLDPFIGNTILKRRCSIVQKINFRWHIQQTLLFVLYCCASCKRCTQFLFIRQVFTNQNDSTLPRLSFLPASIGF